MLLTLLVALGNGLFALGGRKLLKLPGFDITPVAVILLARAGEPVLLASLLLTVAYSLSIDRVRYLWLTLPATILIGYLSLTLPGVYGLLLLYHVLCFVIALLAGFFGPRYTLFVIINLGVNIIAARLVLFF